MPIHDFFGVQTKIATLCLSKKTGIFQYKFKRTWPDKEIKSQFDSSHTKYISTRHKNLDDYQLIDY